MFEQFNGIILKYLDCCLTQAKQDPDQGDLRWLNHFGFLEEWQPSGHRSSLLSELDLGQLQLE